MTETTYTWLSNWIMFYSGYSPETKCVFAVLAKHARDKPSCHPKIETIAKESGASVATARRCLAFLSQKKKIKIKPRYHESGRQLSNEYVLDPSVHARWEGITETPSPNGHKAPVQLELQGEGVTDDRVRVSQGVGGRVSETTGGRVSHRHPNIKNKENKEEGKLEMLKGLQKELLQTFVSEQPNPEDFDYPKEAKQLSNLIKKAARKENPRDFLKSFLNTFHQLTESGGKFWESQPFLPSVANSGGLYPRIIAEMQNGHREMPSQEQLARAAGMSWR